jgi:hypothetical protein
LNCVLRFFSYSESGIDPLMQQSAADLRAGVAFAPAGRGEPEPEELDFYFCDGLQKFQFSFSPRCDSSERLEKLCRLWEEHLSSLVEQPGRKPDDSCEIQYAESIWERIERYS